MTSSLLINGMQGLGDCIHQRALLRKLHKENIYLKTSWPQLYHDLRNVKCIAHPTDLRTQTKNSQRMRNKFYRVIPESFDRNLTVHYDGKEGFILASMLKNANLSTEALTTDFTMKPKAEWTKEWRDVTDKPILVYRPLTLRKEWTNSARNPDLDAYKILFEQIREKYFVITVADLEPDQEWIVSHPIEADLTYHAGELSLEALIGLFSVASMVYTAPGFATIMAMMVSTPVITIFGGYEDSRSFGLGSKSPYLGIDPIRPCRCFSQQHSCNKTIDYPQAIQRIQEFVHENHPVQS